jgi:hypothetical protein
MLDRYPRPIRLLGLGALSWLVPFLVSRSGEPGLDVFTFKTVMILVGGAVGAVLFAYYVPRLGGDYLDGAVTAGVVWFVVNAGLDLVVLVALLGTPADEWVVGTGARYLLLPIQAAAIGYVAENV